MNDDKKTNAASKVDLSEFSSKVKRIYLELNSYGFFHSPSDPDNIDDRFTGREELTDRLKSFLTSDRSKSGAYLITGFRGMGKTSFVSRVISDVIGPIADKYRSSRYFRIFIPLFLLALMKPEWNLINILMVIYFIIYIIFLFFHSKRRYLYNQKFKLSTFLDELIVIGDENISAIKFKAFIKDIGIILVIYFLSKLFMLLFYIFISKSYNYYYTLWTEIVLFFFIVIYDTYRDSTRRKLLRSSNRRKNNEKELWYKTRINNIRSFGGLIWSKIVQSINYSQRVYIRVNLSYDELKEIDIFRLIGESIITQYDKFYTRRFLFPFSDRTFNFFTVTVFTIKLITVNIILCFIYYCIPFYTINNEIKIESRLVKYFPSQAISFYDIKNISGNGKFTVKWIIDNIVYDDKQSKFLNTECCNNKAQMNICDEISTGKGNTIIDKYITLILSNMTNGENKVYQERLLNYFHCIGLFQRMTIYTDLYINILYNKAFQNLAEFIPLPNIWLHSINNLHITDGKNDYLQIPKSYVPFKVIPSQPDYLFFLYFIVLMFLIDIPFRLRLFNIVSYSNINKNIKELRDSISAEVIDENSEEIGSATKSYFKLTNKKTKKYPRAEVREIEHMIIEILTQINKIPNLIRKPEFIFIFDEMDKIEPPSSFKADEILNAEGKQVDYDADDARNRQRVIIKLLANLKYFLTTAKAKFIFIAGREMYDASLADISDRHNYIGSIFHDVINVNSFFTDTTDRRLIDINSMSEAYVCRYLLPIEYIERYGATLQAYYEYITENYFDKEIPIEIAKIEKIMITLQNFITYLTYRSNGSPKKLTRYFEKFVTMQTTKELADKKAYEKNLVVGKHPKYLYLKFDFFDQYTFGLVSHIATPVMFSVNRAIKDFGDNLLVSTAFLLDHIYKFHRNAFSMRDMELTPELVDINKAPDLREFIDRIINYLVKNNIHVITNGFYQFRFTKKISDEISFLSKISGTESAAFNFTLDETLSVESYYKKKYLARIKTTINNSDKCVINDNVSFIHIILGELYLYNEDYHKSIVEFLEAVNPRRNNKDVSLMNTVTLTQFLKGMLLLGLTYEKSGDYTSASAIYNEASETTLEYYKNNKEHPKPNLIYKPFIALLHVTEKTHARGIDAAEIYKIEKSLKSLNVISGTKREKKLSAYEEKIVNAEFYWKIANILFYKNGKILNKQHITQTDACSSSGACHSYCSNPNCNEYLRLPCGACEYYLKSLKQICEGYFCQCMSGHGANTDDNYDFLTKHITNLLKVCKKDTKTMPYAYQRSSILIMIGSLLSNIGDVFLSCVFSNGWSSCGEIYSWYPYHETIDDDFLLRLLCSLDAKDIQTGAADLSELLSLNTSWKNEKLHAVIVLYTVSAFFYKIAQASKAYCFELKKILLLIQEYTKTPQNHLNKKSVNKIEKTLVERVLEGTKDTYENVSIIESNISDMIFDKKDTGNKYDMNSRHNNLSISVNLREILIANYKIKFHCETNNGVYFNLVNSLTIKNNFVSPYSHLYSMRNRRWELSLKMVMNTRTMLYFYDGSPPTGGTIHGRLSDILKEEDFIRGTIKKISKRSDIEDKEAAEMLYFLVTDSIFCLYEVIKIFKMYGFSYDTNHSFVALTYLMLAIYCRFFVEIKENYYEGIEKTLGNLIGVAEMSEIDSKYYYEMATHHCKCVEELHSGKKIYKQIIEKMYYLNDDFNDKFNHFYAALERYRFNTGQIDDILTLAEQGLEEIQSAKRAQ
ncbi:MAG: ATP-binding protein [Nitrospirae bacterium]|nr:ATP-binding protein [Nitrospirota bacterium]